MLKLTTFRLGLLLATYDARREFMADSEGQSYDMQVSLLCRHYDASPERADAVPPALMRDLCGAGIGLSEQRTDVFEGAWTLHHFWRVPDEQREAASETRNLILSVPGMKAFLAGRDD